MKRIEGNGFRKHIFVLHDAFTYNFIYLRYYENEYFQVFIWVFACFFYQLL